MKYYIQTKPEILGGRPVITGTRVPVSRIVFLLGEGYTLENIQEQYPFLSMELLRGTVSEIQQRLDQHQYAS